MIEFKLIDALDAQTFSGLFASSLAALDAGAFRWDTADTPNGKEAYYRESFENIAAADNGFLWQISVDGIVVMYNVGTRVDDRVYWHLALVGNDQYGSKSFFYRNDYVPAEDAFWESLGVTSHVAQTTGAGTPIHNHYLNRAASGDMKQSVFFKQCSQEPPWHGGLEVLIGVPLEDDEGIHAVQQGRSTGVAAAVQLH